MSETEKNPSSTPKERISLKEFIDTNDKLVTALGVMGALAALFTTVKNGQYLAFLAFFMLLALDVELVRSFYKSRGRGWSETLILFETILELFIAGIGIFIIQTYLVYVERVLYPLLSGFLAYWVAIRFYRRQKKKKEIKVQASIEA